MAEEASFTSDQPSLSQEIFSPAEEAVGVVREDRFEHKPTGVKELLDAVRVKEKEQMMPCQLLQQSGEVSGTVLMPEKDYESEEDEEDNSGLQRDLEEPPRLEPFEYVVGKINIRRSLATAFWRESYYHHTPGTFPIITDNDVHDVLSLIDEFMSLFHLPDDDDDPLETWECPRFIPQSHLFFVNNIFRPKHEVYHAELLPLRLYPSGSLVDGFEKVTELDSWAFTSVYPTLPSRPEYRSLQTSRPLLPGYEIYQQVCGPEWCTIGSVTDGQKIFIQPESLQYLAEADLIATEMAKATYVSAAAGEKRTESSLSKMPCGCVKGMARHKLLETAVFPANDDGLYLDFERLGDQMRILPPKLDFSQEIQRTFLLINTFLTWISTKRQ